jgi:hypothetical protein
MSRAEMAGAYPVNRAVGADSRRSRHAQLVGLVTWIAVVLTIVALSTLVIYMAHNPVIVPTRAKATPAGAHGNS